MPSPLAVVASATPGWRRLKSAHATAPASIGSQYEKSRYRSVASTAWAPVAPMSASGLDSAALAALGKKFAAR